MISVDAMSSTLALDLMLNALVSSSDFQAQEEKPWGAVSRLIPGSTPEQCQRRYNELITRTSSDSASQNGLDLQTRNHPRSAENSKDHQLGSSRLKANKLTKSTALKELKQSSTNTGLPSSEQSHSFVARNLSSHNPIMVIHVCDEAKNLKQDFTCPRDLLVQEMRYFAEYLSTDTQRTEEVDISVHCDVQIFDWLMKYVKKTTRETIGGPALEPGNVVSILISSEFLKMDSLVSECIDYCHTNMSAIIATPCNMNCIDDRLVARIADCFNHNELDAIKDRKDKFKSKLFAKKVEKLFDSNESVPGSPENASTLFRCVFCKKILTKNLEKKVRCLQSRMSISRFGKFIYSHVRDPSWDASDWLLEVRNQLKAWSDVYWYVWGTINYLDCTRCAETFSCVELATCRYHPEQAVFDSTKPMGEYQCCGLKILRFDPLQQNQGCRTRDHTIKTGETSDKMESKTAVYNDLLSHREVVCIAQLRNGTMLNDNADINVFAADEIATGLLLPSHSGANNRMTMNDFRSDIPFNARNKPLGGELDGLYDETFEGVESDDDETGDDEDSRARRLRKVAGDPHGGLMDAPGFGSQTRVSAEAFMGPRVSKSTGLKMCVLDKQPALRLSLLSVMRRLCMKHLTCKQLSHPSTSKVNKWDASRSLRYNQDAQREEDQKRMREMVTYLTRLRMSPEKMEKLKQREFSGGIFSRLESQWKAANMPPPKPSNPAFRSKPRFGQVSLK